ncbi:hypothetical protein ACLOJK_017627 [Asimina triloba]
MENAMFSSESFNCQGAQEACYPLQEFKKVTDVGNLKQSDFIATADWIDVYRLSYQCDQYQAKPLEDFLFSSKDLQSFTNILVPGDIQIDEFSTAIQSLKTAVKVDARQNIKQELYANENVLSTSLPLLELPKSYMVKNKRLSGEDLNKLINETSWAAKTDRELSTVDVMKVAAACYIQCSVGMEDNLSILEGPYSCHLPRLTGEEIEDVELAHLLLASAEKISNQLYDRAGNLLAQCSFLSSNVGRPVQRVVYYFADALKERINRETGRISLKQSVGSRTRLGEELEEMMIGPDPAALACHQSLPTSQVATFTEIQAIIENMASAKRIHLIDLSIKFGVQWSILMQALAVRSVCPVELLKITAVGTFAERIAETGRQLESFAEMLKLPFVFKAVIVSDMKDIKEDLFEIEDGEAVGVYASMVLRTMINRPDCLEHVLRVIRKLNPCIMTVTEVEGNHNSCTFINRFIEALFYFSALFDCLDDCMNRNDCNRLSAEGKFFSLGIQSIVATEGNDRVIRHVGIDLWRSFFTRFGFIETEPSVASLYQARLVAKQFACGSSLNFDMNGKSLTIGWKGTPLVSFSAWKLR